MANEQETWSAGVSRNDPTEDQLRVLCMGEVMWSQSVHSPCSVRYLIQSSSVVQDISVSKPDGFAGESSGEFRFPFLICLKKKKKKELE